MALERSVKQFFFAQGPESETTHEAISDGGLTILENARLDTIGNIQHKYGVVASVTTVENYAESGVPATTGSCESVESFNGAPTITAKNSVSVMNAPSPSLRYKWNDSLQKWGPPLEVSSAIIRSFASGTSNSKFLLTDQVLYDGLLYIATTSETEQVFSIVDPESETTVQTLFSSDNTSDIALCRVILFNSKIYFFYLNTSAPTALRVIEYDPATGNINASAPQLVVNDLYNAVGVVYDIWVDTVINSVYLAYKESAANKLYLRRYTALTSGTPNVALTPTSLQNTALNPGNKIAIAVVNGFASPRVMVAYTDSSDAFVDVISTNTALVTQWGPVSFYAGGVNAVKSIVIATTVYGSYANLLITTYQDITVAPTHKIYMTFMCPFDIGGGSGSTYVNYNLELYSKVITIGGLDYVWLKGSREDQECYYLASTQYDTTLTPVTQWEVHIVGKWAMGTGGPETAGPYINSRSFPMQITDAYLGKRFCGVMKLISVTSPTERIYEGTLLSFNLGETSSSNSDRFQRWKSKRIASSLAYLGGMLRSYDGKTDTEVGFPEYPDSSNCSFLPFTGAGSLTASGVYSVAVVYEFIDGNGYSHLSAPSVPQSVTLGAGDDSIEVVFIDNIVNLTNKVYNLLLYRTTASGSIYYLDRRIQVDTYDFRYNSVFLIQSDSDLAKSSTLYTQSGEIENSCVPSPYDVEIFKDRAFVLRDDGLFYSKKVEIGDPLEFSDFLQIQVESDGGKAVAIAALQDKLLIFKAERIYYISGDGPNDTGTYGDFSLPQLINTTYGCISPRSIVQHDNAVFFQSKLAMCAIDGSLAVADLGNQLSFYWNDQPLIRSCVVNPQKKYLEWSDDVRSYLFFFNSKRWSVHPTSQYDYQAIVGSDRMFITNNLLYSESTANILETDGTTATMSVSTGWINLDNIEGFQRLYSFYLLARKRGNHTLTIGIMYDYVPVIVETHTINESTANSYIYADSQVFEGSVAAAATGADQTNKPYQYRIKTSRQKCQSVRIFIEDQDASSGVGTVDLVAGAFEIGFKNTGVKTWMGSGRTV